MRDNGLVVPAGVGLALGALVAPVISYTAALAAPNDFFDSFRSAGSLNAGVFAWETLVVFGLSIGLAALLALLVLQRQGRAPQWKHTAVLLLGSFVGLRVLLPTVTGAQIIMPGQWRQFGPEASLLVAGLLGELARRVWPNNSSKPTPLRGAA